MPYCPQCRYEFQADIDVCPDCHEALVDRLPEDAPAVEIRWSLLGTVDSILTAEMIKGALANSDIPAVIRSDVFRSVLQTQGTGMAGTFAKLFVPAERLAQAEEIFRNFTAD